MAYDKEMISISEAAKRLGMRPEFHRRQIIKKQTPFKSWFIKTPSGTVRYYLPRRSFENWINAEEIDMCLLLRSFMIY